ncbi:DNA repair protein RAD51 homolog 3-like isoform X1 [Pectinophora gossypiella]|uniref:DNA repair protein RAD51 homolog 3-like isoform X1 n=1 Tax=Pectinophora gossypiella TaxID=13191 RepID=UPI00214F5072|nr:DNA repair protein RAD51 homolog 3-like isoform X1 [Pectinophora gossypiella]
MCAAFKIYNATELWQRENSVPSVPSFSQSLDNILGHNGLRLCSLTEVLGLPGTGKTQLCLQLCASIQIPTVLGGLNSEALYIDTNTNFTVERFREILRASISRCQQLLDIPFKTREEDALKKLHYVNALGIEKFCAFILRLPKIIEEKSNVKLIVIDSIPFPFKEGVSARQRTGLLFRLMADLQRLAVDKQIAVLLTNEMSTRVGLSSGSVVGALGDAWAHRCNTRVLLAADPADPAARLAVLLKSPNTPGCVTRFQITHDGIRDVQ